MAPHAAGAPVVVAFWHERLSLMPMLWVKARQSAEGRDVRNRVHVLVSRHRDGRFIGAVVSRFALDVVLGSSSRGGAKGLRVMLNLLASGDHIAITPDGPRGPRRVAAHRRGAACGIVGRAGAALCSTDDPPLGAAHLGSHGGPKPFGRGVVVCLPTIAVNRDSCQTPYRRRAALTAALMAVDLPPPEPPGRDLGGGSDRRCSGLAAVAAGATGARQGGGRTARGTPRHRRDAAAARAPDLATRRLGRRDDVDLASPATLGRSPTVC